MMRDVHVQRCVVGHRPADAKLVDQVVPDGAISLLGHDRPVKAFAGPGLDVPRIDAQALQHRLAGSGQLLDGVHDLDLFAPAQACEQSFVGQAVDARLVASQVDGDAVRCLVV